MGRVLHWLRRGRIPAWVRDTAPFTLSVVLALLVVVLAGSSGTHRPAPVAAAPLRAPADTSVDQFASLHLSRNVPIKEVEDHYAFVGREHAVPARVRAYLPLYEEAARTFHVNWHLIASIHRQETAFSASTTTYHGKNFAGCCAGPMQFNVTNGPVSTWDRYRNAYRAGTRPAVYPHRTAKHPSIYDDFDSIMAAGKLLSASGSGELLGRDAWNAAYDYYGHDLFGITYADTVIARAQGWVRDGFCVNCLVDDKLIAGLDKRFGRGERKLLVDTVAQADPKQAARERARKRRHQRMVRRRKHRKALAARKAAAKEAASEQQSAGKVGTHTGKTRGKAPAATATPRPAAKATPTPGTPKKPKPSPTAGTPTATADPSPTPTPTPDLVGALLGGGHGGG